MAGAPGHTSMQPRSPVSALSAFILAAILSFAPAAFATPQFRYGTGLWVNMDESGWGLNLFHQGDTLFGALFVYGTDGKAKWYVASGLTGGDAGSSLDQPTVFTGALYETTGPWFGGAFDPARVTRRQAGTMRVELRDGVSVVDYAIDGVTVSKQVRPFTFRRTDLSGSYVGYIYQAATGSLPEIRNPLLMNIQDRGATLAMTESSETLGACTYDGVRGQNGQVATVSGTYGNCGYRGGGAFSMAVDMTPDGLTGFLTGGGVTSSLGRIALSRRNAGPHEGNGWRTDLWFPPDESGWGLNVVEQGDTIFATIFVYDAQGRPHWYVASSLARSAGTVDGRYVFSGPLYETTGPYFGAAFNPSAVTRREVGSMAFDVRDRSSAVLNYSVDGVAVTKAVSRYGFRKNSLAGNYIGHLASSEDDPGGARYEAMSIAIEDDDTGFVMRTQPLGSTLARSGASCTYSAPAATQTGEQRVASGTYTCSGGESGSFVLQNAFVTFNGFTASFQGAWVVKGHMEGVRASPVAAPPPPPPPPPPPSPAGKFSFVSDNVVAAPNAVAQAFIQRTGGAVGSFDVNYAYQGPGCEGDGNGVPVRFGDGDSVTKMVSVQMRSSGECNIFLIPPAAPATLTAPFGVAVTVVPQVAGCAVPTNVTANNLTGIGNPLFQRQASGRTLFMPLPATSPGYVSGQVSFGESAGGAFTPQPVTLELSISKCPGIIDTNTTGNFCNLRSTNGSYNSITFLSQAYQGINAGNAAQSGYCWAGDGGQYYINARWTYSSCAFGAQICGFAIQNNSGGY